jgi:hypothetical protein
MNLRLLRLSLLIFAATGAVKDKRDGLGVAAAGIKKRFASAGA